MFFLQALQTIDEAGGLLRDPTEAPEGRRDKDIVPTTRTK